ncbi:aspartic proteinase nepenthesin-2-like [Silene latifolia]|uniref:aspartic proteinase nepenthesin-2-like n=1 Tax=Silene latifolia TaxID=37657 RepID=UPI003D773FE7
MILSDSLDSPMYQANRTLKQKLERLIYLSEARVESLKLILHNNSSISRVINNQDIEPSLHHQYNHNLFLIQVGIGTFAHSPSYKTYYLVLDTAGGPIWTQCEGCNPCFHQRDPVFPKMQSNSYHEFTCDYCPPGTTCEYNHCAFDLTYGDGTYVHGIAATETFTFRPRNGGSPIPIWSLGYGCATHTQNFIPGMDKNNIVSGIFGMSPHPSSFMGQVGSHFGGRFSYCLAPIHHQRQLPPMFLRFGDDIPPLSSRHRHQTPFIRGRNPFYYLDLQSITVGSEKLNIKSSVFQLRQDGSGGCIIDSGSGASLLITTAYIEFEKVLTRNIVAQNPRIRIDSRSPMLCYKESDVKVKFPKVTFHFANNADFVVEPELYMADYMKENSRVNCLMIRPSDKFTILGAYQQVNHRIVYDTVNSELHFASANCFSDN